SGPDGAFAIELDPAQLETDADGHIHLGFDVANPAGLSKSSARLSLQWQVRHFGLEVAGVVQQAPEASARP
ncbi:MAG: hypothetical protein OER86_11495, partial [Phycisphaerae bacterium]|nr:hypothetical protein [Phycisphaerae bacterium]